MAGSVVVLVAAALPAGADTASDLEAARSTADAAQAELARVAALWQQSEAKLAVAQDAADAAQAHITELDRRLQIVQVRLNDRAAELYMNGGDATMFALIADGSVEDVADRLQFAEAVAQHDTDLTTEVAVERQTLAWERQRLTKAVADRAQALAALQAQSAQIKAQVDTYQALVIELQDKLAAEQAQPDPAATGGDPTPPTDPGGAGTPPVTGSGWLLMCPVNGPTSFVDSFGDPRPGGRTHEGIDLIAALGTPVVAVHSGTVHRTSSSTGGYGTVIFHDGSADWTFYTHFSAYAGPSGGHVGAGETIGLVGSTGDTSVNHLHFEYHPGGGGAVDPYQALLGVC